MSDRYEPEPLTLRRSRSALAWWLLAATAVLAASAWFATHPDPLPTTETTLEATTPVGVPVYVGVFAPTAESRRTVHVRGIDVDPAIDLDVSVTGLVCKGGTIAVTSDPRPFCTDLVDAEGASVGPGDVLVLEIFGNLAGETDLDRVRLSYRDGLQWGTQEVGPPVLATFLTR